jgi:outer membrane protein
MCFNLTIASAEEKTEAIELGFKEALTIAQERNAQVVMADERVKQALARVGQAASTVLPHLSASASQNRQSRDLRSVGLSLPNGDPHIGPFNSFDGRVQITQAIFDATAIQRLNAASENKELSVIDRRKAEDDVLALVATLYINARRAQENLQAAKILMNMDLKHWKLAQSQLAQGTVSQLDVDVARNTYAQSYFRWRQAHARETQTRVDLCAALDLPQDRRIVFSKKDEFSDEIGDIDPLMQNHPDIEVAKKQLSVLSAQRNAEQADWLPKISALADYGRSGEDPNDASSVYTVGLQATFPIWEGGNRENRIREAKAKVRESEANLRDVKNQTQARIRIALDNLKQSKALLNQARAQIKVMDTRWKLALQRLNMGNGTTLDVIDAKAGRALALDDKSEALATYKLSQIDLAHALGRMKDLVQTAKENL